MKSALFIFGLFYNIAVYSQDSKFPIDVTSKIQTKIKQDIEKGIPKLKKQLEKTERNPVQTEFTLDTFRIE